MLSFRQAIRQTGSVLLCDGTDACHVYETMTYVVYVTFILFPPEVFTLSEDNIMTQRIAVFLLTAILCI